MNPRTAISLLAMPLAVLLLLAAPAEVHAQFGYSINADNTLTITNYSGSGGQVTIPRFINGLLVTGIGPSAFYQLRNLTAVSIDPGGVTNIGAGAFELCALTNVVIPGNVVNIGDNAFAQSSLQNVALSDGVLNIGDGAFFACDALTSIAIPGSVTNIGDDAFYGCDGLRSVTVSNGVIGVGGDAFWGCFNLTNITIPASVTLIGVNPFGCCESLVAIPVDSSNLYFSSLNGVLFDKNQTTLIQYPVANGASFTIPGTVTNIATLAFQCANVSTLYFTGNAPNAGSAFLNQTPTVYYLPGSTGWDSFMANTGLMPVLWNPLIQDSSSNFGVQNTQFGFNITATNNFTFVVEASTNLLNPFWIPLQTNTLTNGSFFFSDPQWTNYPSRFYGLGFP